MCVRRPLRLQSIRHAAQLWVRYLMLQMKEPIQVHVPLLRMTFGTLSQRLPALRQLISI